MYKIYVSETLGGKNKLIGTSNDLNEAIEMGASHPVAGYFAIKNAKTNTWINI